MSGRRPERLPAERLWLKIGEAAQSLGISPKDLRYWEKVIPEIRARRSQGNLRYYHRDDLPRLARIHQWVLQGFTVADCRQLLLHGQLQRGLDLGMDEAAPEPPKPAPRPGLRPRPAEPSALLKGLRALHARLSKPLRRPAPPKQLLDPGSEDR